MEKKCYSNFPKMENCVQEIRGRVARLRAGVLEAISDLGPFDIPEGYDYRLQGAAQILEEVLAAIDEAEKKFLAAKGQDLQTLPGTGRRRRKGRSRKGFRRHRNADGASQRAVHLRHRGRKHCKSCG